MAPRATNLDLPLGLGANLNPNSYRRKIDLYSYHNPVCFSRLVPVVFSVNKLLRLLPLEINSSHLC